MDVKTAKKTVKKTAANKVSAKKTTAKKKTLVIVESPAKAKTIEKYLGASYRVKASMGHLIDLPKSRLAIDVDNNFEPEYITVRGRAKLLKELQTEAKNSDGVLLASDNDREGEAIAWHLQKALSAKNENLPISRISFNEITPQAIKAAVAAPTTIDDAKVNAQKARRVLDRLVGYNLSPLLWKKVKNGLSAGRVQSVALRLICEREKEIEAFTPEEYWTLDADFKAGKTVFTANLVSWNGEKPELHTEADAQKIVDAIKDAAFTVKDIRETDKTLHPRPPFTTSQLQQTAANRLGFTSKKTMQLAQQLYEGVSIGGSPIGLITYMRTDSVRISQTALEEARLWIGHTHPDCLPEKAVFYSSGKQAQDAHEAIRPTYVRYTPDEVKDSLSRDQHRLYSIIWERFIASQMKAARTRTMSADISPEDQSLAAIFRVSGTVVVEQGFMKVLNILAAKDEKTAAFPPVKKGDTLKAERFKPGQHFTQGPARFTDAGIVKTLEEKGIGRPSTYAPTISVLLDRGYVSRANKQLVPSVLGRLICDMLVEHFGDVVNADFTAGMETGLDEVEGSARNWPDMIRDFYKPFKAHVDEVGVKLESVKGRLDEKTDEVCDKCGKPMLKKLGRYGYFLACSGFPECRNTKSIPLAKCPKCGGDIVARRGRGKKFYGCAKYPECDFLTHFPPLPGQNCPKCGWFLVEKYDKRNGAHKACINPDCDYPRGPASGVSHTASDS
ncbi:MAG: type I DNA topoisomerase [Spirochaetaceae bacterium]|jgi:DNA topoisomerase-1|nr:type I DNA topoisomerase [Spirochaetaceae bacterium]